MNDKRKLSCFGNFDGDYAQCIRCHDSECLQCTDERIRREDDEIYEELKAVSK